jgi:hypothetical protein
MTKGKKFTTSAVGPVVDNHNVPTAGPRGPQLLQGRLHSYGEGVAKALGIPVAEGH